MLHALRKRQIEQMQREEMLVGIISATSANFSFCRPDKPLSPESFMLHPLPNEPVKQLSIMDAFGAFRTKPIEVVQ